MIAAWRLPGARVVTIEAQDDSVRLARKSAAYNGLESRYEIRHGDFRQQGGSDQPSRFELRRSAVAVAKAEDPPLRPGERFDLVLGSPPYFQVGSGIEGDHPQKVACRFELRGDIADYARTAERHLANGGLFACVFPDEQRARIEAAARDASLTIVRRRPVVFKDPEPPLVALFAMMRALDLPDRMRDRTWVEPPLIIRSADGTVHPEYAAVKLAIGFPPT
jgi:tRNA1(Val) A37 N6-methylase TrmN6